MAKCGFLYLGEYASEYYLKQFSDTEKAKLEIIHTDFDAINQHLPEPNALVEKQVQLLIDEAITKGITHLIVPNFTLHQYMPSAYESIELIDPRRLLVEALVHKAQDSVTLFGTYYTMQSDYPSALLKEAGISAQAPDQIDVEAVDALRKKTFIKGSNENNREALQRLISKYKSAQGEVVICCTELSLLNEDSPEALDIASFQIQKMKGILASNAE